MKSFDARNANSPSTEEPLMVLATTFAEATTPSKHIIQENTLRNLAALQPSIRAVVFSDSPRIAEHCKKHGIDVIAEVPKYRLSSPILARTPSTRLSSRV